MPRRPRLPPPSMRRRPGPPPEKAAARKLVELVDAARDMEPDDGFEPGDRFDDGDGGYGDPRRRGAIDVYPEIGKEKALQEVTIWVERVLSSPEAEGAAGGSMVTFELRPVGLGAKAQPIDTFTFQKDEDPVIVADTIVDRAIDDGESVGRGKGSYSVTAKGLPNFGRRGFRIEFGQDPSGMDLEAYGPDHRGQTMFAMESMHESHEFAFKVMRELVNDKRNDIHSKNETIDKLQASHFEMIRMSGEIYRQEREYDLKMRKQERGERRLDEVGGFLMAGAPALMNRFLGEKIMKESATPLEHQTEGFLRAVSHPEDVQKIVATLGKEKGMAFLELLASFSSRAEAQEAERQKQAGARPPDPVIQAARGPETNHAAEET